VKGWKRRSGSDLDGFCGQKARKKEGGRDRGGRE
jgi:hypothetical protein